MAFRQMTFRTKGWYHRHTIFEGGQDMSERNELDLTCGLSDDELTERFKAAVFIEDEIKRIKGVPIAGYDEEKKRAYLEHPDGKREYVTGR